MKKHTDTPGTEACGCEGGRREFLCRTAALVAGLAASTGGLAAALPIRLGEALSRNGDEATYPIPATDSVTIDQANAVIVVRYQGKMMVLNLACPHQQAAVRWKQANLTFECTKHDSVYKPDGTYVTGRATRNLDRLPVHRNGNSVVANVAETIESDTDQAAWNAAFVAV